MKRLAGEKRALLRERTRIAVDCCRLTTHNLATAFTGTMRDGSGSPSPKKRRETEKSVSQKRLNRLSISSLRPFSSFPNRLLCRL